LFGKRQLVLFAVYKEEENSYLK